MKLQVATNKSTGFRYFYSTRVIHGRKQYTADCTSACVVDGALKITWHNALGDARKTAQERGTILSAAA